MAKPLNERLATALTNAAVRSADLETLIAEVNGERERLTGIMSQANEDALNLGLSDEDRDAAAQRADRARRDILAYGQALESLQAKLAARVASEQKRATADRRAELLAERDRIAEKMKAEWPALEAAIVSLLSEVTSNEAQMRAAGIHEPNAEAIARNVPGNFARGPVMIRQLTKLALPSFADGNALAWPAPAASGVHWTEQARQDLVKQRDAQARRAAAEAAAWGDYSIKAGEIDRITEVSCQGGAVMTIYPTDMTGGTRFDNSARTARLHSAEVARLRRLGMAVEPVS